MGYGERGLVEHVGKIAARRGRRAREREGRRVAHQRPGLDAAGHEMRAQGAADETRSPRDRDGARRAAHRSVLASWRPTRSALAMMLNVSPFGGSHADTQPP